MNNYLGPGDVLQLVAPYDVASGAGALVGGIFGVATGAYASGATGQFKTDGAFTLPKTSAQAWAVGDKVYWDDTNKRCDTDSTVGPFIGVAIAISANPSASGAVKLADASPMSEGAQAAVANVATADADATYGSPEASLINELKAQVNSLLAELRTAGILKP